MKVKLFVVTYNNDKILNEWFLRSLRQSEYPKERVSVNILNNYSDKINIDAQNLNCVERVFHNTIRLDISTGHLSRDWNHGIMNAFKNLKNPEFDIAIMAQNDTVLRRDWYERSIIASKKYAFVTYGAGDQFQIINPDCVMSVGMYDERFCNIACQAADYFARCLLIMPDKISINDSYHGRVHNPEPSLMPIEATKTGAQRQDPMNLQANTSTQVSIDFWNEKWSGVEPCWWTDGSVRQMKKIIEKKLPRLKMQMLYPYFEMDIEKKIYECAT